jgi:hypothetical protein
VTKECLLLNARLAVTKGLEYLLAQDIPAFFINNSLLTLGYSGGKVKIPFTTMNKNINETILMI